jgi:hypothetical protein
MRQGCQPMTHELCCQRLPPEIEFVYLNSTRYPSSVRRYYVYTALLDSYRQTAQTSSAPPPGRRYGRFLHAKLLNRTRVDIKDSIKWSRVSAKYTLSDTMKYHSLLASITPSSFPLQLLITSLFKGHPSLSLLNVHSRRVKLLVQSCGIDSNQMLLKYCRC